MKIKNITVVNLFILSFIFLTSCRARFYTPNRNPVPLFKNKGDLYLDGFNYARFSVKYQFIRKIIIVISDYFFPTNSHNTMPAHTETLKECLVPN